MQEDNGFSHKWQNPHLVQVMIHWAFPRKERFPSRNSVGRGEQRPTPCEGASKQGSKISGALKVHLRTWNHKDVYPKHGSKAPWPSFLTHHLHYLDRGEVQIMIKSDYSRSLSGWRFWVWFHLSSAKLRSELFLSHLKVWTEALTRWKGPHWAVWPKPGMPPAFLSSLQGRNWLGQYSSNCFFFFFMEKDFTDTHGTTSLEFRKPEFESGVMWPWVTH